MGVPWLFAVPVDAVRRPSRDGQTSLPVSRVEHPARRPRCVVCCPRESRQWNTRLCKSLLVCGVQCALGCGVQLCGVGVRVAVVEETSLKKKEGARQTDS